MHECGHLLGKIRFMSSRNVVLFDLEHDPAEKVDLVGVDDEALAQMELLLDACSGLVAR